MPKLPSPTRDDIELLPLFPRVELNRICLVSHAPQALQAFSRLQAAPVLGFDTESKPTFVVGEVSAGPHVVQFALPDLTYVFQLHDATCRQVVADVLTNAAVLKVGFGLSGDHTQIQRTLAIAPVSVLDINTLFKAQGYAKEIGVKGAVAVLFGQRLIKSRKATTSNWANPNLSESQLLYAANDAYAALMVYLRLMHKI